MWASDRGSSGGGAWVDAEVLEPPAVSTGGGGKHKLSFADGSEEWVNLSVPGKWKHHATRAAPGAAGTMQCISYR